MTNKDVLKMNIQEFITELAKLNINLNEEILNNLATYANMLIEYNQKFNLTAITKLEDIYLKHFYDSLTLIKAFDLNGNLKLLDIGTGAGFPGLVLKIVFPNLDITLIDSNNKKISFLNQVITNLKLTNIKCFHCRAEEFVRDNPEYFDIVTSRAVAHIRILAELSLPSLKIGGIFLPMKGNIIKELAESKDTLNILNAEIIDEIKFNLPLENSTRTILKIQKTKPTPSKYPRNFDKIKKYPLK